MKISEVAEASGLSIDTLRFYEKIGLIDPPPRDDGGRRDYGADILGWIRFLDQLNATGMKQADRIRYAELRRQGAWTHSERRQMLEEHRAQIAGQLDALRDVMALMDRKVALYRALEAGEVGMSEALERGRAIVARINPGLEAALADRYDGAIPDMAETLVEWAYGRHYARDGLDLKTRQLCTVAALTALGGQTGPQLKVNIEHTLAARASEREILEVIWQMAVYGGLPAAINGLNAALEVFGAQD